MRHFLLAVGLLLLLLFVAYGQIGTKDEDLKVVRALQPLKPDGQLMFWRPQKVGSSTLLSILMSYAYRYNFLPKRKTSANSFCRLLAQCAVNSADYDDSQTAALQTYALQNLPGSKSPKKYPANKVASDKLGLSIPWRITLSHEVCNMNSSVVDQQLACAFRGLDQDHVPPPSPKHMHEIFMVREPLSRAVSVYYFWGELFKLVMSHKGKKNPRHRRRTKQRQLAASSKIKVLGSVDSQEEVQGSMFKYHGSEQTVPPLKIALDFAAHFPYHAGMPGPSYTWSAFANNYQDAITKIESQELFTVVLERLDESLVALSHHLNWSLADVVVTKHRKALSQHPKVSEWPAEAVLKMKQQLTDNHEFDVYSASVRRLDKRIAALKQQGVHFEEDVLTLRSLRHKVTQTCLNDTYLENYRQAIAATGLPTHPSNNKLRDVEQKYQDGGHLFSFNREIVCSFDVCGSCEAHALLAAVQRGLATSVEHSTLTLFDLPDDVRRNNLDFEKCPQKRIV